MDTLNTQLALGKVLEDCARTIRDTQLEQWTEGLLLSRLELLERYWTDFTANHVRLLGEELAEDLPYFADNRYQAAEETYAAAKGALYDARARFNPPPPDPPLDGFNTPRNTTRLPKITLPTFDGRRENWESFRDMFRSLIHENDSLPAVDKLYYLKTSVVGEAKAALDSLQVTGPNYLIAWTTLESRYDHSRLLTQEHIRALRSLRPLKEESASGLQTLLDDLERHRDQLRSLGRPIDNWDDWFVAIAADAVDLTTRRDWEEELETLDRDSENVGKYHPTFDDLADFLRRRCRTLSSLLANRPTKPLPSSGRNPAAPFPRMSRTVAATTSGAGQCASCNERHYIGRCASYRRLSPRERYNVVLQHRLCFNCLRERHSANDCPSPSSCQVCGAQHHTTLHDAVGKRAGQPPDSGIPVKQTRMETESTLRSIRQTSPDPAD